MILPFYLWQGERDERRRRWGVDRRCRRRAAAAVEDESQLLRQTSRLRQERPHVAYVRPASDAPLPDQVETPSTRCRIQFLLVEDERARPVLQSGADRAAAHHRSDDGRLARQVKDKFNFKFKKNPQGIVKESSKNPQRILKEYLKGSLKALWRIPKESLQRIYNERNL